MALRPLAPSNEMSQKDFWIAAFVAALHRVDPARALAEADEALQLSNQRWCHDNVPPVLASQYLHRYPLGYLPSPSEMENF